ncbi:MAG: class I SAM-dependent methyltransferase [Verrucomicrobiaceae bacterium]|nr:class I SAM-dependent methyltransferase [Verrucomicrobiaceae bacterium]
MNPALDTLMRHFSGSDALAVPSRTLFLGAEPHPDLAAWTDLTGWQPIKHRAEAWDRAGLRRIDELPEGRWPVVLVLPGKSRDEILASFALARDRLEPGGHLVAALSNATGAGRFEKTLAKATGAVRSLQKNKCRAFAATEGGDWDEALFAEWRALTEPRTIPGTDYTTRAGLFSSEHIDPGSQMLVDHLPDHLGGRVADLGAGWGFLSAEALQRAPRIRSIDLFEADARALDRAKENLRGDPRAAFHWHDVVHGLPGTYDHILMNPPFHTGQATRIDLGKAFIQAAAGSLRRGGTLHLVANRQLPYEAALEAAGLTFRRVAENKTYKLIFAEKRG